MSSSSEVYSEIIKTASKVFSGVSLALAAFISIVFILVLDVPGNTVKVGGYDVVFTPALALWAVSLSVLFLSLSCLTLGLLLLIDTENDASYDN
ncbi:MAG: hypothetical protein ACFB16_22310 [Phormidesmis sp.]